MRGYIESSPGLKGSNFRDKKKKKGGFGVQYLHGSCYTKSQLIRVHVKGKVTKLNFLPHRCLWELQIVSRPGFPEKFLKIQLKEMTISCIKCKILKIN